MPTVKFANNNALFFNTLKARVNNHFKEKNISSTGNSKLYFKSGLLILGVLINYIWLVFYSSHTPLLSIFLWCTLGFFFATIGFNIMHDGAHGSYSDKPWLNKTMALSLDVLGGSSYMWNYKHNIAHHSFTNINEMDEDINIKPLIRTNIKQSKEPIHRFQHIYCLFIYSFSYAIWIYVNDFQKLKRKKIANGVIIPEMDSIQYFQFWMTKLIYLILFVFIPIWQLGFLQTLIGYTIMVFLTGILVGIVFQLAHVNSETTFIAPPEENSFVIENEWAIHQVITTANFATKHKWHNWFWGGLNFQIEHHLFPRISHVHYPAISKIVKKTCQEYNVNYAEFPTFASALKNHLSYLKQMGRV